MLATVSGWLVDVLVACVLARLSGLTSMLGAPAFHGQVTGTTTRSVPLPGPGSGSSLVTQRLPGIRAIGESRSSRSAVRPVLVPPPLEPL